MENNEYTERKSFSTHWIIYILLGAGLVASLIWGIYQYNKMKSVRLSLDNQYNRAFHEMVGYVDDIETLLHKGMLVNSAAQLSSISSDIFRQSTAAKASLGQLPVSEVQLDNTAKFLSQVGDYTYVLSQNMINGGKISDEDYKNLESLTNYAADLNQALASMQEQVYNGTMNFSTAVMKRPSGNVASAEGGILEDLEKVEKSFEEYPSLIYDGPFSEHIENRESVMLKNAKDISMEEARQKAQAFLGEKSANITYESDTQNTAIDGYTFIAYPGSDRQISISVTKKGGYISYFLDNRSVGQEKLDFSSAIKAAQDFLESKGITAMTTSYYDKLDGIATINFAYMQDNVTCYSDLIKVRVALDDGEILGMEAKGYLMNHAQRSFSAPKLTPAQAQEKINPRLTINSVNLALIPKDSMEEVLSYEFQGSFNDRNYIIYVNADNGREEQILMLIESPEGILTV